MLKSLEKRTLLIYILIGFLVYGLICYGFPPTVSRAIQVELSGSASSGDVLPRDWDNYYELLPIWQMYESNIIPAQIVARRSLYGVYIVCETIFWNILYYHPQNADIKDNPLFLINLIDEGNKPSANPVYQFLDIPPPLVSVSG